MSYYSSPIPSGDSKASSVFQTPTRFSLYKPQTPDHKALKRRMSLLALGT